MSGNVLNQVSTISSRIFTKVAFELVHLNSVDGRKVLAKLPSSSKYFVAMTAGMEALLTTSAAEMLFLVLVHSRIQQFSTVKFIFAF